MARIISASINLSKIDKTRIVKGKKGTYYNVSIIVNDEANDYGQDVSLIQEQSKEERAAKDPKVYLGNGKTVWRSDGPVQAKEQFNGEPSGDSGDSLPF